MFVIVISWLLFCHNIMPLWLAIIFTIGGAIGVIYRLIKVGMAIQDM